MEKRNKKTTPKQPTLQELAEQQLKMAEEHLRRAKEQEAKVNKLLDMYEKEMAKRKAEILSGNISFNQLGSNYKVKHFENNKMYQSLSKERIKKIPIRKLEWFKDNRAIYFRAYSLNGKEFISITTIINNQAELLHALQSKGYRFIFNTDEAFLEAAKDCRTCEQAGECPAAVQASTLCPATDRIEEGFMRFYFSRQDLDKLKQIDCIN